MTIFVQLSAGEDVFEVFFEHLQQFTVVGLLFFQQFHLVFIEDHFVVRVDCQHVFLVNLQLLVDLRLDVLQDLQNSLIFLNQFVVGCVFI
jgi:hypothetical protein